MTTSYDLYSPLENYTTEELEAELEARKTPKQTPKELLEERLVLLGLNELKDLLYSCYDIMDYFRDRMEEDYSELFYEGGQLQEHATNISTLLGYNIKEDEWQD